MPKINVYLPDDLAEGVKATGVPETVRFDRPASVALASPPFPWGASASPPKGPGPPAEDLSRSAHRRRTGAHN